MKTKIKMKTLFIIILILSLHPLCAKIHSQSNSEDQNTFTNLTGPYLGQSLPGKTPEVFAPGVVSTDRSVSYLVVASEGNEIFFMDVVNRNGEGFGSIYFTKLENGFWTKPVVAPFSGTYCDGYMAIHPNGSRMYFQSDRPIEEIESRFEWNIWYIDKENEIWGEPGSIGKPINGNYIVSGPSVTDSGTMYFTIITNKGSINEIYRSEYLKGEYQQPERLSDNINLSEQQFDSYIAPDESFLIYGAYNRGDSYGGTDLYISFRDLNGNWSKSVNMGPSINSSHDEGSATITFDQKYIFFSRYNNTSQSMDIFWFSSEFVEDMRPVE